jgi:hypothetical protein
MRQRGPWGRIALGALREDAPGTSGDRGADAAALKTVPPSDAGRQQREDADEERHRLRIAWAAVAWRARWRSRIPVCFESRSGRRSRVVNPNSGSILVAGFVLATCATAAGQSIFVTTVADVVDFPGPQTVAELPGADGRISMREACLAATHTPGPQTIGFQIPSGQWGTGTVGPVLINAGGSFTVGDDFTTIDGTTQTAFTGDTNPDGAEVSFFSTVTDPPLIQSGTILVRSNHNVLVGLGDMVGNRNYGIDLAPQAQDNRVVGCVIRGRFAAVRVQGDSNRIGGVLPGEGNRLTSLADGLRIHGLGTHSADGNLVFGNFLTGEANGLQLVGNATGNVIGGFAPGERNVIAGAGYLQEDGTPDGAMIRIESDGNLVLGNFIGTDATGTLAANNVGDVGIEIYGDGNQIRGNVIGGITGTTGFLAVQAGIDFREGAANNVIAGNSIGVDASGTIPIPNHLGIVAGPFDASLEAPSGNTIGGMAPGEGNVIAHNEAGGVVVLLTATGTRVTRNSIHSNHGNGGLGIDLGGDGVTPNDHGDLDAGPNDLLNSPVLASAVVGSQGTVVVGSLAAPDPSSIRIELFANPPPAPGEIVEAATFLGAVEAAPSGAFVALLSAIAAGSVVTATATDAAGNTSEISLGAPIVASPWIDLGFGLAGTRGVPVLTAGGTLAAGTPVALALHSALAQANAFLVLGPTAAHTAVLGGTLVPSAHFVVPFATDAAGSLAVHGTWPGAPVGTTIHAQVLVFDPAAPAGVAFSNAIRGTTP